MSTSRVTPQSKKELKSLRKVWSLGSKPLTIYTFDLNSFL
jgi:hypothetical protein